jgi:excisionase family DNA binding protein
MKWLCGLLFWGVLMRPELQRALDAAKNLPAEDLPRLLGDLREIEATANARLASPPVAQPDENLEIPEAAHRLGVSPDYLYRNHARLPFTRRMGRKLLFSASGIDAYLRAKR